MNYLTLQFYLSFRNKNCCFKSSDDYSSRDHGWIKLMSWMISALIYWDNGTINRTTPIWSASNKCPSASLLTIRNLITDPISAVNFVGWYCWDKKALARRKPWIFLSKRRFSPLPISYCVFSIGTILPTRKDLDSSKISIEFYSARSNFNCFLELKVLKGKLITPLLSQLVLLWNTQFRSPTSLAGPRNFSEAPNKSMKRNRMLESERIRVNL